MTSAINPADKIAYLLVTHGSRDPRSQAGAEQLAGQLQERFGLTRSAGNEQTLGAIAAIATAVLELGPAPLHTQIEQFAHRVAPIGVTSIKLLPLFLLPGVHVREDLPEELALAQAALTQQADLAGIVLQLLPHLGAEASLLPVLKAQQQSLLEKLSEQCNPWSEPLLVGAGTGASLTAPSNSGSVDSQPQALKMSDVDWALVAHGSRRSGAVATIADLAHSLGARPAYWVGSPSLTDCIEIQRGRGTEHQQRPLGCLSYFLFEGGITDRLAVQLETAEADGPAMLSAPLGAFDALVDVVVEAMERSAG